MSDTHECPACGYTGDEEQVRGHIRAKPGADHEGIDPRPAGGSDPDEGEVDDTTDSDDPDEGAGPGDGSATTDPSEAADEGETNPQEQALAAAVEGGSDNTTDDDPGSDPDGGTSDRWPPGWGTVAGAAALGVAVLVTAGSSGSDDTVPVDGETVETQPADEPDETGANRVADPGSDMSRGLSDD